MYTKSIPWAAAIGVMLASGVAAAAEITVPVPTQVEMLGKLVGFDRSFRERAGGKAKVLVVENASKADSHAAATEMKAAFMATANLSGVPIEVEIVPFRSATDLAGVTRVQKAVLVYIAPGLTDADLRSIAKAFDGVNVLSAVASPDDVLAGAVVGFDMISDKPKIVINLPQAQKQGIAFSAGLLSISKVYR